jgi:hypothetical protein
MCVMRKRRKIDPFSTLMEIAQAQQGYFTTRQAIAAGYADNTPPITSAREIGSGFNAAFIG